MSRMRIGEVLTRMGKLDSHDIDEILQEQSAKGARYRFGEIALTWGMVEPQHIWKAWCEQLADCVERVDLNSVGIDTQATAQLPAAVAARLGAMPIRVTEDDLLIAVGEPTCVETIAELHSLLGDNLRFVLADPGQIRRAIARYYPAQLYA